MENIIFGIITVLICSVGYFFSWKFYKRDNYRIALVLLIFSSLYLYFYVSADFFLHLWDERYHALVAKNLIKHPLLPTLYDNPVLAYDYRNWGGNHIWIHKQPFPLWTMAASMSVFGVNEIALRLPSVILSTIGIWLIFSIGEYLFSKKVGYVAAFLFSVNGLIIELTGGRVATDHVDIFFMFFILLAIFFTTKFIQRKKTIFTILTGVSIGIAILSKWLPALIVLPIWILLVTESNNFKTRTVISQFILLNIIVLLVFIPWQLYIFSEFPDEAIWESSSNFKHFTEVLSEQTGPVYYFFNKIRMNYGELIYLPLFWFLWNTFKNLKNKKRISVSIWFLIPLIVFSLAKTKMQAYLLFTAPALFLMTSDFYFMLLDYKKGHKQKWFFKLILILLIALPIRYGIERIKPFEYRDRNPQWITDLKKLNIEKYDNGILFNFENPIEAMFYTDLTVYTEIPEKEIIIDLMNQGYTVIINDNNIPSQIAAIDGIIIKKLNGSNKK